jgi:hypothetical protein
MHTKHCMENLKGTDRIGSKAWSQSLYLEHYIPSCNKRQLSGNFISSPSMNFKMYNPDSYDYVGTAIPSRNFKTLTSLYFI